MSFHLILPLDNFRAGSQSQQYPLNLLIVDKFCVKAMDPHNCMDTGEKVLEFFSFPEVIYIFIFIVIFTIIIIIIIILILSLSSLISSF